jgi:hypothetical protein
MEIPALVLRCVGFVAGKPASGDFCYLGTFFVATRLVPELPNRHIAYAITARHVIDDAVSKIQSDAVYLRVNYKGGEARFVRTTFDKWIPHFDSSVDLVVTHFPQEESMDVWGCPLDLMLTNEIIAQEQIGPGEALFFPGLFARHSGKERNIPIVRVGSIAAMRDEKVFIFGKPTDVYLAETHSIGGLSGSPVFVHISGGIRGGRIKTMHVFLMGLLSGHWDESSSIEDSVGYQFSNGEKVNVGIAFVVPADKIVETINYPDLRDTEREWISEQQATLVNSPGDAERHRKKRFPWLDWRSTARKE